MTFLSKFLTYLTTLWSKGVSYFKETTSKEDETSNSSPTVSNTTTVSQTVTDEIVTTIGTEVKSLDAQVETVLKEAQEAMEKAVKKASAKKSKPTE